MKLENASPSWKRCVSDSAGLVIKRARYSCILAGLFAIGWYGHATHWTFRQIHQPDSGSEVAEDPKSITADKIDLATDNWRIEFPSEKSLALSGISTVAVQQESIVERVNTAGVITFNDLRTARLSARTSGTVWDVCKRVGDSIRSGDVLIIVDSAEVGRTKAEFLSSLVTAEAKAEILANLDGIGGGAVPLRLVREARVELREARIRLLNAEQNLVNLGFCIHSDDFENIDDAERAGRIRFLGLPESITRKLDRNSTTSNLLPIRATFDGVIVRQDVAMGETAEAGKPLLEISDTRQMWLKLDVTKEDASRITLGQQVMFEPDGIEQYLHAAVTWVSTEMNEKTRTLQIRAEVDNPLVSTDSKTGQEIRLLRANTYGTGTILLKSNPSALVVPASAVLHDDRQPLVFARTGELCFERVDVTLGVSDGDFVEILAPKLTAGTEIVSRGGHVLKSEWSLNHIASRSNLN